MDENKIHFVDAFLSPHEAVSSFLTPLEPKYIFGKEAIRGMLQEYIGGFHLFSFANADYFIRNLYHNLRILLNIYDEDDRKIRITCNNNALASVNKYLKDNGIEYHFKMVGFGSGEDYLKCEKGYIEEEYL